MRLTLWFCGLLLLQVTASPAANVTATFNVYTTVAISGLVGGTGLSETGSELENFVGNGSFDNLRISDDNVSPSEPLNDVTEVNSVPEPTPFILVGLFAASYVIGRKLRVKAA